MRRMTVSLILIAGLSITGCKTANKGTACGTACGTSTSAMTGHAHATCCMPAPQTSCAATTPCTAKTEEPHPPVAQVSQSIATPESPFESMKSLEKQAANPFKAPASAELQTPAYAHGEQYEWLVGVLQRVHSPGREWKIRYSPLSEEDEWGGSMVLAPDARLDDWNDGDVVYVEGEILAARPSLYLSGPLYRFHSIRKATTADVIQRVANQQ